MNETVFCDAIILNVLGIHLSSCTASMQIAEDYSHCQFLIRLPGYCPSIFQDNCFFPLPATLYIYIYRFIFTNHCLFLILISAYMRFASSVPAFRDVVDAPLVVRRLHKTRQEVSDFTKLLHSITSVHL